MHPALETRDSPLMRVVKGSWEGNALFGIPAGVDPHPYASAVWWMVPDSCDYVILVQRDCGEVREDLDWSR